MNVSSKASKRFKREETRNKATVRANQVDSAASELSGFPFSIMEEYLEAFEGPN
jgi:hypothetical protein